MNVKLTKKPIPTVAISGEVDHYNAHLVAPAIREACQIDSSIILDLSELTYLDSAGVQLVFLASRLTDEKDGHVVMVVKNDHVRRILEITGTESIPNLSIVTELEEAIKKIGKGKIG